MAKLLRPVPLSSGVGCSNLGFPGLRCRVYGRRGEFVTSWFKVEGL